MNKKQTAYAMIGVMIVMATFVLGLSISSIGQIQVRSLVIEGGADIRVERALTINDFLPIFILLPLFLAALAYIIWREIKDDKRAN